MVASPTETTPVVRVLVGFTCETGPPSTTDRWNVISRCSTSMSDHLSAPSSPRRAPVAIASRMAVAILGSATAMIALTASRSGTLC